MSFMAWPPGKCEICSTFEALLFVQVTRHVNFWLNRWWQDYLFGWKTVGWFGESFAAVLTQTFNIYTAPNSYTFKVYSISQHDKILTRKFHLCQYWRYFSGECKHCLNFTQVLENSGVYCGFVVLAVLFKLCVWKSDNGHSQCCQILDLLISEKIEAHAPLWKKCHLI